MNSISLLVSKLQEIPDFRNSRGQRYKLYNILAISILALISGADDFESIAEYARSRKNFLCLHKLLDGKNYPSHDLFRWIFSKLDKKAFAKILSVWLEASIKDNSKNLSKEELKPRMIHIDGKSLRGTRTSEHTRTALQIISAYCSEEQLCIGQSIIDKKSCESTAIPKLLDLLDLKDSIVTIDAVATTKKNVAKIIDGKGDYILALKKNNKLLFNEVENFFLNFKDSALIHDYAQTIDKKHGRIELRKCRIIKDLEYLPDTIGWKGLQSLVYIEAHRSLNGKTSVFHKYYLSSLKPNAKSLMQQIRQHWSVENNLHWSLDVAFNEDKSRLKNKNAAANLAAIRRFALALIKNAKCSKHSVKTQRLKAAWDDQFLEQLFQYFQRTY